jgi:RNA polymerase sigma factor (sigma-70 family)
MPAPSQQTPKASFEERVELVTESVDLYHKYLLHFVFSMTNQWQDAENIVQELWKFVMVYFKDEHIKHLPRLRLKAKHLFIDHYREKQRKPAIPTDQLPEHHSLKTAPEAFTDAEESNLKEVFFEQYPGIELSEAQKEVIWLHGRYGYTHKQIAKRTGVPASTVGDWIKLARKRIAEHINIGGK